MDIVEFIFIALAVAVGVVSLVVELSHHIPFGKALVLAVGNGFIAFVAVAFGSALILGTVSAVRNRCAKKKDTPKEN